MTERKTRYSGKRIMEEVVTPTGKSIKVPKKLLPSERAILSFAVSLHFSHTEAPSFYGYEVAQQLNMKDAVATGRLYKILARMERWGFVVSRMEEIDSRAEKRRPRTLYQITDFGISRTD